jgi:hypothetical protein
MKKTYLSLNPRQRGFSSTVNTTELNVCFKKMYVFWDTTLYSQSVESCLACFATQKKKTSVDLQQTKKPEDVFIATALRNAIFLRLKAENKCPVHNVHARKHVDN